MPVTWQEARLAEGSSNNAFPASQGSAAGQNEAGGSESSSPSSAVRRTRLATSTLSTRRHRIDGAPNTEETSSLTVCNDCFAEVAYFDLRKHLAYECPQRQLNCGLIGCNATFAACDEAAHKEKCAARKLASASRSWKKADSPHACCPRCSASYEESTLREHLCTSCPRRLTTCRFCLQQVEHGDLFQHMESHISQRNALAEHRKKELEDFVPCPACDRPIVSRKLAEHQQRKCSHRLVTCPNHIQGCKLQVAAKDLAWHMKYACSVTLQRNEMTLRTKCRVNVTRCVQQCGELVKIRNMRIHCGSSCSGQFMQCLCGATIRKCDQAEHTRKPLVYSLHRVPVCPVARRRDVKAERYRIRQMIADA